MEYEVYNESCIEGSKKYIKDNSIDLIFTDPPYGIKGDEIHSVYNRNESKVVPGYIEVPSNQYCQFSIDWIKECERVLRPGGSIYIISGYTNLHHILNALHKTNLIQINHLIAQYSFGVSTKNKWVSSHYHILYWAKKDKKNQKRTFNSNWKYSDQKDSYHDRLSVQILPRDYKPNQIKNKNQLSEKFIDKFIKYSSNKGDIVLDYFCGSFSTGKSALRCGRKFIGFELNKNAYEIFTPLLENIKVEKELPPINPDPLELEKRNKLRQSWKLKRKSIK
jgi:site-specific DNA-methyltransferase (adenine-specific)